MSDATRLMYVGHGRGYNVYYPGLAGRYIGSVKRDHPGPRSEWKGTSPDGRIIFFTLRRHAGEWLRELAQGGSGDD